MRRALAALAVIAAFVTVGAASGTPRSATPLKIGDAVDVVGTKLACFAIRSNSKDGMACVLWANGKAVVGSYGAGLAVDGTAVLTHIKADGSGQQVFKRRLQRSGTVYRASVGDVFGLQISSTVSLGCSVLNVTSTLVGPLYRGIKVSCWRATSTAPLPNTYGVTISDKLAGVFRFDTKGHITTWGVMRRQSTTAKGPMERASATVADPITGSWLFTSRRGDLSAMPLTTITATANGFDIVTNELYKSGAPQGVTFSVAERAAAYDDNAQCTVAAGAVVGHFSYTGTDSKGIRNYQGQMLTGQVSTSSPSSCSLIGLQGTYYGHLAEWSDSTQKPPLADGPYNRFCISDSPGGCYVTFDRKGGTAAPAATTTTPATTGTAAPVSGLVPRNPKIPPDKRFKNDHTPPTVKAVASTGTRGSSFYLDYYSKDDRGFAGETYAIYRGKTLLKKWGVLAGERDGRLQRGPAVLPSSVSGQLTFCVGAQDLNGNRSPWSCAPLTIT